jgi:hypothetical protein
MKRGTENRNHHRISFCLTHNSFFCSIGLFRSKCFLFSLTGDNQWSEKTGLEESEVFLLL